MIKGLDIISTELDFVTSIFPSITSYYAGDLEEINDNKTYPNLMMNIPRSTLTNSAVLNSGMPKKRSYSCRLLLSDEFDNSERSSTTLTEKFEELETVLAQYLGKVYTRGRASTSVISINGQYQCDYGHRKHHDNLVTVGCDIEIHLNVGNCDSGTFTDIITPTNLTSTVNGNDIDLSWTDNSSNEDGFYIYRSDSYLGNYTLLATNSADDVTYTDLAPTKDTNWFYKIQAFDGELLSAFSSIVSAYIPSSSSTFVYDVFFDGVDTGDNVTVDGTDITINLD